MITDSREKQQLPYSSSASKKWQQRKTAIAISMATCLFLGVIGYEIVREKEPLLETPTAKTLFFPQENAYDHDLITKYTDSLQQIQELKKLLFLQKHIPQNKKVAELNNLLQEREEKLASMAQNLNMERKKTENLHISLSSLTDSITRLQGEREKLVADNLAEQDHMIANFERHLSGQEFVISNLKEKNTSLEGTLQAAESAWKDYALDLTKELQILEKDLAVKEEQKFYKEEEVTRLLSTLHQLEQQAATSALFIESFEKEFDALGNLHANLEEKYYIERALDSMQSKGHQEESQNAISLLSLELRETLAKQEEIKAKYDELEIAFENRLSEKDTILELKADLASSLLEQSDLKIAFDSEKVLLLKELATSQQITVTLENKLREHNEKIQELIVKENANAEMMALELKNTYAKWEESQAKLAEAQAQLQNEENNLIAATNEHQQIIKQLEQKLIEAETVATNLHLSNFKITQLEIEIAKALLDQDKLTFASESLQQELERQKAVALNLEHNLLENSEKMQELIAKENANAEMLSLELKNTYAKWEESQAKLAEAQTQVQNEKNKLVLENAEHQRKVNQLENKIVEMNAIASNIDFSNQTIIQLEKELAKAMLEQEQLRLVSESEKATLLQEIETTRFSAKVYEDNLSSSNLRIEELQARVHEEHGMLINDKSQLLQEVESFKLVSTHMEEKLSKANLKLEELQERIQNEQIVKESLASQIAELNTRLQKEQAEIASLNMDKELLSQAVENFKIAAINLENKLIENNDKFNEILAKDAEYEENMGLELKEVYKKWEETQTLLSDAHSQLQEEKNKFVFEAAEHQRELKQLEIKVKEADSIAAHIEISNQKITQLEVDLASALVRQAELAKSSAIEREIIIQELDTYKISSKNYEDQLASSLIRIGELQARLEDENSMLIHDKSKLLQEVESYKMISSHLEGKLNEAKQKLDEVQMRLLNEQTEKSKINSQIAELQMNLKKEREEVANLHNDKALLIQAVDTYKLSAENLENKLLENNNKIQEFMTKENSYEEKMSVLQKPATN